MMTGRAANRLAPSRRGLLAAGVIFAMGPVSARAASRAELEANARAALQQLYASEPKAAELGAKAKAVLIFPKIVKAGFMIGGQSGNGVLFEGRRVLGYFNISAGSFGFQAGAQTFGYALFFMTTDALAYLTKSQGWAIGSGPSVVLIDKGKAKSMTSTTLSQAVYAMPFGQQGLMAGMGLEGSKITPIHPEA